MSNQKEVVEVKGKVEQVKVRGRNVADVVSQLVEKYNSSNGWSVLRVIPTVLSLEVILERSVEQGKQETKAVAKEAPKAKQVAKEEEQPKKEVATPKAESKTATYKQTATTKKTTAK